MANVEEKKSVDVKLTQMIQKNRKVILIVCAVIVAVVVIVGIATAVSNNAQAKWMEAIETAEADYSAWSALAEDDAEKAAKTDTLKADLTAIVDGTKDNYPDMKAAYVLGLISFEEQDYAAAAGYFGGVVTDYADSYLAPTALMNEAVSLEMQDKADDALDRYQKLVDTYSSVSAEASHALFSIGRIYEVQGNTDLAKAVYEQLVTDYASSEWTKLAQVRLIALD